MKPMKINKFPYDESTPLSNFHDDEFSRLAEAVRSLFFRRLKHFPLATEITFQCAMHIVTTTEDEDHCFPVAVFSVDKEIESVLGPGNPSVSVFLMDCISDVFRGQRKPNFIGIVAEKPNAE